MYYYLCIIVYSLAFVFTVDSQNNDVQKLPRRATRIFVNGKTYNCEDKKVDLKNNDTVEVEMTHNNYINYALIKIPSEGELDITNNTDDHNKKNAKFIVTPKMSGKWIFSTLTNKDAPSVTNDENLIISDYKNSKYYNYSCQFNVNVTRPAGWTDQSEDDDKMRLYYFIGGGVLALIIVIQTGVICYILKVKKVRRIEQMALNKSPRGNDTARYSTTPRKPSLKSKADPGSIYETLDILQSAAEPPPPPPIETLPRPAKAKTDKGPQLPSHPNQQTTLPRTPVLSEEERIRRRPPMPPPDEDDGIDNTQNQQNSNETEPLSRTESDFSVHTRVPGKVKIPVFCVQAPSENASKPSRNTSTINQVAISNELNNILKRRRTGTTGGLKPQNQGANPEPIPETKPTAQGLRSHPPSKPSTPIVTPAKPKPTFPCPVPKNPPSSTTQKPNLPQIAPKTPTKWGKPTPHQPHPLQKPQPNLLKPHPSQSTPHPMPTQAHPILPQMPPMQSPLNPISSGTQWAPNVVQNPDEHAELEPEYAEYDDSADEWTYEPLDPSSKYKYDP